jgi:hypothetical protein
MASLNSKYGSELHLLRMLGRHRSYLDQKVLSATKADAVEWRDFPSNRGRQDDKGDFPWDREWEHVEFLAADDPARKAWDAAWPRQGTGPNWDAIAKLRYGNREEWLLVEAKANVEELSSACGAKSSDSIERIRKTLDQTKIALGVPSKADWMRPYYQFCNRLAVLHTLNGAGTPARLLFVYFYGDRGDQRRTCPESAVAWDETLVRLHRHVGLPDQHALADRIHYCRVNVTAAE